VLTHLPVDVRLEWMKDLGRVLRPGGLLLFTVHGESHLPELDAAETERFRRGECVVRWSEVAGSNLCTTFHPEVFVRGDLASGFEVVEVVPGGALGNPPQDLVLLRKPATGLAAA
jgi:SAM-dependent methyltransferase